MKKLKSHWKELSSIKKIAISIPLVLIMLAVGWRQWRVWSIPDVGEPFDVSAFVEPYLEEDHENAFPLYAKALYESDYYSQYGYSKWNNYEPAYLNFESAGWQGKQWVVGNQEYLARCRQFAELEYGYDVRPDQLRFSTLLSMTQNLRDYARLQILEASMNTSDGNLDEAWEGYRAVLNVSRQLRGSCMIGGLVGIACQSMSVEPFSYFLASEELTVEQLRRIQQEMDELYEKMPPVSTAIKSEYFGMSNELGNELKKIGPLNAVLREEELTRRYLHMVIKNWLSQCDLPRPKRGEWKRIYQQSVLKRVFGINLIPDVTIEFYVNASDENQMLSGESLESNFKKLTMGGAFLSKTLPAIDQGTRAFDRGEVCQFVMQLQVALHLYHRENGKFPETLEDLVPEYIEKLPYDPFGKGEPIKYRHEGEKVVLYTVGEDGRDQGGLLVQHRRRWLSLWSSGDPFFMVHAPGTKAPVVREPAKAERP